MGPAFFALLPLCEIVSIPGCSPAPRSGRGMSRPPSNLLDNAEATALTLRYRITLADREGSPLAEAVGMVRSVKSITVRRTLIERNR